MPDELRSPIKHHLVLHRHDPKRGVARFYSLMIERDLFGRVVLVRNWGRIGTNGRELVEAYPSEIEASQTLAAVAQAKRRWGYRDLIPTGADPHALAQSRRPIGQTHANLKTPNESAFAPTGISHTVFGSCERAMNVLFDRVSSLLRFDEREKKLGERAKNFME